MDEDDTKEKLMREFSHFLNILIVVLAFSIAIYYGFCAS